MMPPDEFIEYIDALVPSDIYQKLNFELGAGAGVIDILNVSERARVLTIKQLISSTHKWTKATCINDDNSREEMFWCENCNIKCSEFEHIKCLSIISKVKDNKPTYTTHNQYLMLTCSEVLNFTNPNEEDEKHCYICGIPQRAQSKECTVIGYV